MLAGCGDGIGAVASGGPGAGSEATPAEVAARTDFAAAGSAAVASFEEAWSDEGRDGRPVTTFVWAPETAPAGGYRGAVVISHGQGSTGNLHNFLGEHLAAHGYVAAAPDHWGSALGTPSLDDNYVARVADLKFVLDRLAADGRWPGAVAAGAAAVGHSIGGFDALALCGAQPNEAAVREQCEEEENPAYCALLAVADRWSQFADSRVGTCVGHTPFVDPIYGLAGEGAAALDRPALLIGADEDTFLPLEPSLRRFFAAAPQPGTVLLTIHGAGHLDFTDALRDGSLPHDDVQEIAASYTLAWLAAELHGSAAGAAWFAPSAVSAAAHGEHLSVAGTRPGVNRP